MHYTRAQDARPSRQELQGIQVQVRRPGTSLRGAQTNGYESPTAEFEHIHNSALTRSMSHSVAHGTCLCRSMCNVASSQSSELYIDVQLGLMYGIGPRMVVMPTRVVTSHNNAESAVNARVAAWSVPSWPAARRAQVVAKNDSARLSILQAIHIATCGG